IDGIITGSEWSDASVAQSILNFSVGTDPGASDISGSVSLKWDSTNLYVLFQVTDDARSLDSSDNDPTDLNSFEDDTVEVYLDMNHTGTGALSTALKRYQYRFGLENSELETAELTNPTTNFAFAHTGATSYVMEIEMPWTTLGLTPTIGATLGFDAAINDDDDGGSRDNQLFWNATMESAFNDASQWGDIQLTAAIPEPSTVSFIFGLTGLVFWIVVKKRKRADS
ncbi:MAG: hypothetical protein O7C75_10060, partial [Verrucomicrobia bacterium]|nr:hypothetical protein [Verrucomicrobiota bacterium]